MNNNSTYNLARLWTIDNLNNVERTEAGLGSTLPCYILLISDDEPIDAPTRTYNAPTCVEVAAIVLGINPTEENHATRYVTIQSRGSGQNDIKRIPETHSSYDPLSYICTHIKGDGGWNLNMKESPTSNNYYLLWTIIHIEHRFEMIRLKN